MFEGAVSGSSLVGNLREANPRRFVQLIVLSLLVHLVLTPVGVWFGAASWLDLDPPDELPPPEPLTTIPIDIFEELEGDAPGAKSEPAPPPTIQPQPPSVKQLPKEPIDPEKPEQAKPVDAEKPRHAKGEADAGVPDEPEAEGADEEGDDKSKIADPTALIGDAAKVVETKSNVTLLVYNQRVREHALGKRIGKVLAILPQWNSFFGPSGIDPVADLDTIWVSGPQFRQSAEVAAVLGHHLPQPVMVKALDAMVQQGPNKGKWLRKGSRPAARAWADRAERVFALPNPGIVIVAPVSAEQSALSAQNLKLPEPKGDAAVIATVKTPWRALIGTGLNVPQSLSVARLEVSPVGKEAVRVRMIAEDASPELAKQHARELTVLINTLASGGGFASFLFGEPFIDHVELKAEDKEIHGETLIRPSQLQRLLNFVESWIQAQTGRVVRTVPSAAPKPTKPPSRGTKPQSKLQPGAQSSQGISGGGPIEPRVPSKPSPPAPPVVKPTPAGP